MRANYGRSVDVRRSGAADGIGGLPRADGGGSPGPGTRNFPAISTVGVLSWEPRRCTPVKDGGATLTDQRSERLIIAGVLI